MPNAFHDQRGFVNLASELHVGNAGCLAETCLAACDFCVKETCRPKPQCL